MNRFGDMEEDYSVGRSLIGFILLGAGIFLFGLSMGFVMGRFR